MIEMFKMSSFAKLPLIIIACLWNLYGIAQSQIAIGEWKAHLPYFAGIDVTQSDDEIIYSTEWGLLFIDKNDFSIRRMSTVQGLSSTGIQKLIYHPVQDILVVAYNDGVIDLVDKANIETLNDIKDFKNFPINKRINALRIDSDSTILIAADFGISRLDLNSGRFLFTSFTSFQGIKALDAAVHEDVLYMGTDDGLFSIPQNQGINLSEFTLWKEWAPAEGVPSGSRIDALAVSQDSLYAGLDGELFQLIRDSFELVFREDGYELAYLQSGVDKLLIGMHCEQSCDGKLWARMHDGSMELSGQSCTNRTRFAVEDELNRIWYADAWRDFRYAESFGADCKRLRVNSPYSQFATELAVHNNELHIAAGGVAENFTYLFRDHGYFHLANGEWSYLNRNNHSKLKEVDFLDVYRVEVRPSDGRVYLGSFLSGLAEIEEGTISIFDQNNSSLQGAVGDESRERVAGLDFDSEENLWITNFGAPRPISVYRNDGSWQSFPLNGVSNSVSEIAVDDLGNKWVVLEERSNGVLVFDEGDPNTDADDRRYILSEANSALPNNFVNCIEKDLDGDMWVGTLNGPIVFENCGDAVFDGDCYGFRHKFELDGDIEYLLGTEEILSIAVDGANRKWFGTRNGLFVISANGEEEVARFTTENSPLFNNTVNDIAINQQTGEVFIATDDGVISYRSDAVEGGPNHDPEVIVFPNPVHPDYDGPIAIKGLPRDGQVKITDLEGRLVYETQSLGGQAIWYGRDYTGRKVSTGVYYVFSNTTPAFTKPLGHVAKILFIN